MDDVRIASRVKAGAEWLDQHRPGWLGEIDLITLDLRSPCRCILGQLHGDFANVPGNAADCPPDFADNGQTFAEWAAEHGFYAFGELAGDGPAVVDGYRELTLAWTDLIERRIAEEITGEAARVRAACCPCRGEVCKPGCTCADCPKTDAEVTDDAD